MTHLRCQTPPLPQARVTGCGAAAELPGLALASLLTPGVIVMLPAVISEDYYIISQLWIINYDWCDLLSFH